MAVISDGLCKIYSLEDLAHKGDMPEQKLVHQFDEFYEERMIGFSRSYAAKGVNEKIDALVRIWENRTVSTDMYVILEDGNQYRITLVQHIVDDGLKYSDLTLERLDNHYDLAG